MEENCELEEGEAGSYNDDEDNNVNPDIAFSYIDEKIQNALGHFQKDFEGCVITEDLGEKTGQYGSFLPLPTLEGSPHPKTPHRSSNAPKSPNKFPLEGASQRLQAPSSAPPSKKHNGNGLNNSGVTRQISSRQDLDFPFSLSDRKSDLKVGKSGPLPDLKKLKFRIKVGSDCMRQKSAAIYTGLGIDDSPSSSRGNSTEGYGGMQPLSQDIARDSPTSILQVMTNFPVPGDFLLSPLHDSLLCIIGKQVMHQDSKSRPYQKALQGHSAVFSDGALPAFSDSKVSKHKEKKFQRKREREVGSGQGNDAKVENETQFSVKKNLESDRIEVTGMSPDNLKSVPFVNKLSSSVSVKASETASKVAKKANSNLAKKNVFSSTSVEDSLVPISGQDNCKNIKNHPKSSSFVEVLERTAASIDNHAVEPNHSGSGRCKSDRTFNPSKLQSSKIKCIKDVDVRSTASTKLKIKQAMIHTQDMANLSSKEEHPLAEGKKNLQDVESGKKVVAISSKQKLSVGVVMVSKVAINTIDGISTSKRKMLKLKSQNDVSESRDNSAEGKSKQNYKQLCPSERAFGDGLTCPGFDGSEGKQNASFVKSKVRVGGQNVGEDLAKRPVKDGVHVGSHVTDIALASAKEDWVFCESCEKWRLLPSEIDPDDLPEKWLCGMQDWLPGMNQCDISEEETVKAIHALYQLPPASCQSKTQSVAYGTSSGVITENMQHFDHNHQTVKYHGESTWRRKKRGFKDVEKACSQRALIQTSNFTNNQLQEPAKSRNLSAMNQIYADSNLRRRPNFDNLHKSHSLVAVQLVPNHKENHMNEAEMEQVKIKTKRKVNNLGFGKANKKIKTENMSYDNKCWDSNMDLGNVDRKLRSGFLVEASGKNVGELNEYSSADDLRSDNKGRPLVKYGKQAQLSSDAGSLDMRTGDEISTKKRQSDWLGNLNGQLSNTHSESGAIGWKREKKLRVLKSFAKESRRNSSTDKSKKISNVAHNLNTNGDAQPVAATVVVRTADKDGQSLKPRNELASQALDGKNSSRKVIGSGQFSASATSSSSKVSGSVKIRGASDNVKASPVESVSSSPLRTPLERPTLAGMDIAKHDNTIVNGLPFAGEPGGFWDARGENKIHQSGIVKKEKVCGGSDPESLNFPLDYQGRNADHKFDARTKSYLVKCETEIMEHNQITSDSVVMMGSYDDDRTEKGQHKNFLPPRKFSNHSSLKMEDSERTSSLHLDWDNIEVSGHVSEQGNFSFKKNGRHNSEADPKSLTPVDKKLNTKQPVPDKSTIKSSEYEKRHAIKSDSTRQCSKDNRVENLLKLEECSDSDANKLNASEEESKCGTCNLPSHFEGGGKQDSQNHKFMKGSQLEGMFDGCFAHAYVTGDASRAERPLENAALKNGPHQVSGHCVSELKGAKYLYDQSPGNISSSSVTVAHILKEAKKLQESAEFFKSKGFGFESNESYFQAAIKYLSGACLLEICSSVSAKQGEMSQMQVYSITTELFEGCAQEYERQHEMAAAALAYKCMEVAYWRLVSCKNSSSSRYRNELQASLQMLPQGESPSSSASDVDNLNNQASVDKTTLSKGSVSHVTGNPVSSARNYSSFLRLLDFTRDVNFAIDASRKSQNAFLAANSVFDKEKHKECVTSVKKVIDFSFHDVDELIHLVQLAQEAISRSGFGGARD